MELVDLINAYKNKRENFLYVYVQKRNVSEGKTNTKNRTNERKWGQKNYLIYECDGMINLF